MRHAVAKNSTTAARRADQRRKADTPDLYVLCPTCGRKAYLNRRDGAYFCGIGKHGRVAGQ